MTGLTYIDRQEERDDRQQQEGLLAALHASPSQFRRDECGWWIIAGRRGAIHTRGDGKTWGVYVVGRSARHWTAIKQRLSFMIVTQDGDEEGCLRLFELPSPDQAAVIREVLLLRKRRTMTEEARDALIAAGVSGRFGAHRAATAPGLVPDAAPTLPGGKSVANVSINAAAMFEPEEVG